jgi:hypothetical protein
LIAPRGRGEDDDASIYSSGMDVRERRGWMGMKLGRGRIIWLRLRKVSKEKERRPPRLNNPINSGSFGNSIFVFVFSLLKGCLANCFREHFLKTIFENLQLHFTDTKK